MLAAIARANDYKGLTGPTSRNRQSCENLKISFENFFRQSEKYFLGATVLAENVKIWKIEEVFYRWCLETTWQMRLGWLVYFTENVVYVLLILS